MFSVRKKMRRGDRLFQIVQLLRTHKTMTALQMAERLLVSERTIYRDMQDLSLSSVPIISETGVGYSIDASYSLPPIVFNENELEALLLGVRMVQSWSDKYLAMEATRAIEKIACILPKHLKPILNNQQILVPDFHDFNGASVLLPDLRSAIKQKNKVMLHYSRIDNVRSKRIVWPLGLFFWGKVWTIVAWCEIRNDFRQFRVDRIKQLKVMPDDFQENENQSLTYYLLQVCNDDEKKM